MPSPQPNLRATAAAFPPYFWVVTVAGGMATGLAAGLLMRLLRAIQDLGWHQAAHGDFLQAVAAASWPRRVAVVAVAGIIVAIARLLMREATGGHGAGVDEAIWFKKGKLPFWHTTGQAVLSIVIVALGASLGREAAPKQMGALFGGWLARRATLSASHARLLAACGAGAGIAAVYNVPFGGTLFALEVMLGSLSLALVPPALVMAGTATMTAWLLLPAQSTYAMPPGPLSASLVAWSVLVGPIAGIASVAFTRLISWADTRKPRSLSGLLGTPIIVFFLLGLLAVPLPAILGNGKDDVQAALVGQVALPVLLGLVLLKPIATAACLGSGAPGGLFTPTLSIGAALGGLLGAAWMHLWPGSPIGAFTIVGLAAMLAGTTLGPISAIVLALELVHEADLLVIPVMLAVSGAVFVVWKLDGRSVYSCRVHRGRRHADLSVAPTISAAASHAELSVALLQLGREDGPIAVVDQEGRTVGTVSHQSLRARSCIGPLETATAEDFVEGPPV